MVFGKFNAQPEGWTPKSDIFLLPIERILHYYLYMYIRENESIVYSGVLCCDDDVIAIWCFLLMMLLSLYLLLGVNTLAEERSAASSLHSTVTNSYIFLLSLISLLLLIDTRHTE